jgi:thiol-disulfide isomerase/thioredoxin
MKSIFGILLVALISISFITPKSGYNVGDLVSDFSLKNIDGKIVSLSSFKDNKGVIVIFDCNTCPYSKAYNDRILALGKKYEKTFPIVAINANDPEQSPGDSFEEMIAYAKDKGYTFPYLFDETQKVAKIFGATNTPHVFVLNRSGNEYKLAYIGTIDDNARNASAVSKKYVEQAVDACLAGNAVTTTKTKALGCGIKWK